MPLRALQVGAAELKIDIVGGTLHGKRVNEYTIDEITDLLGRPTTVVSPTRDSTGYEPPRSLRQLVPGVFEPRLRFHNWCPSETGSTMYVMFFQ